MQARIDDVEASALKGGVKIAAKLGQQLKQLENELEGEQRRHADASKNLGKADRRAREILFQGLIACRRQPPQRRFSVEEERKNYNKLVDLVEKLQAKIKGQRRQIEEAEETANVNLCVQNLGMHPPHRGICRQKYRQMQTALDTAEERADAAETNLLRLRSRSQIMKSASAAP